MKLFKNISLAFIALFLTHFSFFYRRVAMLCSSKKASIEPKTFSLKAQQTFLNNFSSLMRRSRDLMVYFMSLDFLVKAGSRAISKLDFKIGVVDKLDIT